MPTWVYISLAVATISMAFTNKQQRQTEKKKKRGKNICPSSYRHIQMQRK